MSTKQQVNTIPSLVDRTLEMVKKDSRDLLTLSRETGAPYHWLKKFKAGEIPNPSANRIQSLYESLTGKKLV